MRALAVGVLVGGSWWINAAWSSPGWACDTRTTGSDMWQTRSTSLNDVLSTVEPPDGATRRDPDPDSTGHAVRQYLIDGEIAQEVNASRADGFWGIDSVTSC